MAAFALATPPSWLLPRSVFQQSIADCLTWRPSPLRHRRWLLPRSVFQQARQAIVYLNNAVVANGVSGTNIPANQYLASKLFHFIPDFAWKLVSFEDDYLNYVLGWMGWSGFFPLWAGFVVWKAQQRILMSADPAVLGPNCWDRRWAWTYDWPVPVATPADWPTLWADYAASYTGFPSPPSNWPPNKLAYTSISGYPTETIGALAALNRAGVANALAEHDWLFGQVFPNLGSQTTSYKWAVSPQ